MKKYECKFCKVIIDWEDQHPVNGLMWCCEQCGESVCSKCIEDITRLSVGASEEILCPDCLAKQEEKSVV